MQLALPFFLLRICPLLQSPFAEWTGNDGIGWGNRKIKWNLSNFQPFYNSAIVIPELQGKWIWEDCDGEWQSHLERFLISSTVAKLGKASSDPLSPSTIQLQAQVAFIWLFPWLYPFDLSPKAIPTRMYHHKFRMNPHNGLIQIPVEQWFLMCGQGVLKTFQRDPLKSNKHFKFSQF